jgi:UDP-GlcNAc:undecaprenyl-phosphate GlcNAc-1-phosphate transferase
MFLVGLFDDIREMSLRQGDGDGRRRGRLVSYGVTMFFFRLPFMDVLVLSDEWIPLITVLWVLGISQAINLIDGLDGLATGIVAIGALAFFLYSQHLSEQGLLTQPNIGPLGVDHHRRHLRRLPPVQLQPGADLHGRRRRAAARPAARVSTSVVGGPRRSGTASISRADVLLPGAAVHPAVHPRRADPRHAVRDPPPCPPRAGVATADKGHLHHRLMEMGHGQRRSVVILWTWTGLLSAFVLYPVITGSGVVVHPDRRGDARPRAVHRPPPADQRPAPAH